MAPDVPKEILEMEIMKLKIEMFAAIQHPNVTIKRAAIELVRELASVVEAIEPKEQV